MSEITVASTTDTQEAVNQAALLDETASNDQEPAEQADDLQPVEAAVQNENGAEQEDGETPQPETRKTKVQKRLDTLTRKVLNQQEELEALRERAGTDAADANRSPNDPRPIATNYRSYEEYIEALADWKAGQRLQQQKQTELVRAEQERTREVFDTYNEAAKSARVKYEDFEEVVGRRDLKIPQAVQAAIIESGAIGPDIAYYLGKHPELCSELTQMSPMRAIARIGQIEAQIQGTGQRSQVAGKTSADGTASGTRSASTQRLGTSAPAPITPVGGTSRSTTPVDQLPYRDYKRLRDQEERAGR